MNKLNIGNLERILNGIWSGELPHDQSKFEPSPCGTSRCVAGWDCKLRDTIKEEGFSYWDESKEFNGLYEAEAVLLFSEKSTKNLQELVLKAFKEGRRLEIEEEDPFEVTSVNYLDPDWQILCFENDGELFIDHSKELEEFLKVYDDHIVVAF